MQMRLRMNGNLSWALKYVKEETLVLVKYLVGQFLEASLYN